MIYGTPGIRIEDDQTDRIGFRTLTLSKLWQPSRWPMEMAELDEEAPVAPAAPPFMEYLGRQTRPHGGGLRTFWTYEGFDSSGKGPQFRGRGASLDYQFDPGFSQVDLLLHPDIQDFLDQYSGTVIDGELSFPPKIGGTGGGGLRGAGPDSSGELNPMFGQRDFLRFEGAYTYRYAALSLSGIKSGVGEIHTSAGLPGEAPSYPGRDWLKAPSPYRRRGPGYDIQDYFLLSGPGGWPRPIYGRRQR